MSEFKYVPVEPTEEMMRAAYASYDNELTWSPKEFRHAFREAVNAAPLESRQEPDYRISACYFPNAGEVELSWERGYDGTKACLTFPSTPEQGKTLVNVIDPCVYYSARVQPSPAESDKEAVRNAALDEAAKECDIIDGDCSECPEMAQYCAEAIRALKSQPGQPSDSRTEFSDTEMLDWLLGDGDTICEMTDGSFEYYDYTKGRHKGRTPRDAIKSAMRAEGRGNERV